MKIGFSKLRYVVVIGIFLVLNSCKDDDAMPSPIDGEIEMEYFNLSDTVVKAFARGFSVDVNHDGRKDLKFGTLLVGDPIEQVDKVQFFISTNIGVRLPVNNNEAIPVLNNGDTIVLDDFDGYQWFELSSIVLVQKIISSNSPYIWEGSWKDAVHKFIPYQVKDADKRYNGWIEISVDIPSENIILHRAALSKTPDQIICVGK
ncbi:MAG: hypothetical protein HOO91_21030 [Bacteroidales bacterium]|nr:hypothetical protein [Bacteroidales bacterium]